ncbi:MAG: DNA polymerase III subunit epsilon [Sphingomonas sp.]|nr:DNA polymerase III subunit epsilon [Sphingomonas sp.]
MLKQHDIHDLIERIEAGGTCKVLHKVKVCEGRTGVPYYGGDTFIGVVVDVETTGLNTSTDLIIELALRRFRYDSRGRILKIDANYWWLEEPGCPVSAETTRVTGLRDADVAGQRIDDAEATRLLRSAGLVIAHNAAFDRKFVERRLPEAAGLLWACTLSEIDWGEAGIDGQKLGWLASQAGWFFEPHRASNDVDAVFVLLSHKFPDGRTALADLIARSATPSVIVDAIGAHYDVKEALRLRGYRWNPAEKVWSKQVPLPDLGQEESWLDRHVYGPDRRSSGTGPRLTQVDARTRFA